MVGGGIKAVGDGISDLRSDDAKEASRSSIYTQDEAGDYHLGNIWSDPARASIKLLDTIGTFGGVVASGVLTGGAVKSMVTRTMLKRGASEAIAKQTAELAAKKWSERAVAGSAMGISVGGAADNAREEYNQLSDSEKLNSPTFADTVKSVYEQHPELSSSQRMEIVDEQMREKRASYVKSDPATYAAAAAGTMLGDSALFKMVTGRAGASEVTGNILSRAGKGFIKGGVGEGVGEGVEDGTQRNVLNRASNAIDNTNINPMQGVLLSALESGTLGFATGGGLGAGSAVAHGSSKPAQQSESSEQQGGDAQALSDATQPADLNSTAPVVEDAPDMETAINEVYGDDVQTKVPGSFSIGKDESGYRAAYVDDNGELQVSEPYATPDEAQKVVTGGQVVRQDVSQVTQQTVDPQQQNSEAISPTQQPETTRSIPTDGLAQQLPDASQQLPADDLQNSNASQAEQSATQSQQDQTPENSNDMFSQLTTVRVTKRGQPFSSQKEAQLASRKTETPIALPTGGFGVVDKTELEQVQASQNQQLIATPQADVNDTNVADINQAADLVDVNELTSNQDVAQNQQDINVNEQPVSQTTVKQNEAASDNAIVDASRDDNEQAYGGLQKAVNDGLLTSKQADAVIQRSIEVAKAHKDRSVAGDYINEAVSRMRGERSGSDRTASTIELYERGNRVNINNAGKYNPDDAISQLGKPVIAAQPIADQTEAKLSHEADATQNPATEAKPELPWTGYKEKPDGTMLLEGDSAQLSEWAKANNVLTIKSKSGVIVGKKSTPIVKDIIAKNSTESRSPEATTQNASPQVVAPWKNVTDKADGTMVMEGDPVQLREWAKQNNITAIKSKTGIVVGKNSVPAVKDIIAKSNAPTNAQQNEATPTEILPSQPTEIIAPPQSAEAEGSISATSVPWTNSIDKPDGTMILEGDPVALKAWAKDNGVTAIKSKNGVVVGKSSVQAVKDFISKQHASGNEEVKAAEKTQSSSESQLTSQPVLKSKSVDNQNKSGISKEEVDRVVEEFKREYKGNIPPEIIVKQTQEEAYGPEATVDRYGKIEGGYLPAGNQLHIIADNISTKRDGVSGNTPLHSQDALSHSDAIRRVLRHEILGHYGLNTLTPEDKADFLRRVLDSKDFPGIKSVWDKISNDRIYREKSDLHKAEELFAYIAERGEMSVGQKAWNKFGELVVKFLRLTSLVKSPLSRYEINSYAKSIAKGIRSGEAKQQNFPETDDQVIGKPTPPDSKKNNTSTNKETADKGGFSLSTMPKNEAEISGKGMTKPEAALVAKQWLRQFKTDINVAVVKDQAEFESALADRGFANSIQSGEMDNAAYLPDSKTILINASAIQNPKRLKQIMRHEILVHHGLRYVVGEDAYVKIMNAIAKGYETSPEIRNAVDTVTKNYADKDMFTQMEEAFAHYAENIPADSGPVGRLWQRIVSMVKSALQKVNFISQNESEQHLDEVLHAIAKNMRNGIEDGVLAPKTENAMFSHGSETDPFKPNKEDVDNYRTQLEKGMRSQRSGEIMIDIGSTPEVLKAVGAPDLILRISRDTIRKAVNGVKHDVPMNVIEKLPELLHDPISVFDSKTHPGDSLVVLLDAADKSGRSVVSAIQLKVVAGKYLDINRIASIHGRPEAQINQWLSDGLTRYIKENHLNSLHTGLQLPLGSSIGGHDFSVLTDADIRKRNDAMLSRSSPADDALMNKLGLGPKQDVIDKTKERINKLKQTDRAQVKSWIDETTKKANTQILDYLAPIKYAEDKTGGLDASESGYVAARLASGSATVMNATMLHGLPAWKDGVIQRKNGTGEADSLLGIFEGLGSDLHNWLGWMAGHRAERLLGEGRENLLTPEDISALKDKGIGKEAKFEAARQKWNALNKAVLDLAEEAGLFTAEDRAKWDSEWYVPFFRETEDGDVTGPYKHKGIANQTSGIKKLKGGTSNVNDILQNIFTTTSKTIDAAMKNMAAQKVVHNLVETDLITVLEKPNLMEIQAASKNQGNKLLVKIEGENYVIQINDEPLFNAMTMIDQKRERNAITRSFMKAKHLLTAGTTSVPSFMARNFIRDAASTWVINEDGFKPIIDSVRGAIKSWNMDESSINMMFSGASFMGGNLRGNDPEAMASAVRKALRRKGMSPEQIDQYEKTVIRTGKQAMDLLGKYWEQYERVGEAIENGSREAVYEAAIKAGKSHAQAAFEAKDLMDFSMHGSSKIMQWFVDVLPFFNARMQGLGKLGRAIKANPKQIARRGGMIAGASLALLALNWDDDRYNDLPDWDKDLNWHFWLGDQHVRIPKPFEIGLLFGTLPERMARVMGGKDTAGKFGQVVARNMLETFAINPIPQAIRPLVEVGFNYDMFRGAQIDNMSDQNKLPEARYDERTSILMRELGELTGFSPKKLEHLVTGYTGGMGAFVMGISDFPARAMGDYGSAPAYRAEQIPLLGTFLQGSAPARSTQSMQDFYSLLRESNQVYSTIREYVEEGKTDDAEKLKNENIDVLRKRPILNHAQKQFNALRNEMELIERDKSLNADQKRERIDRLLKRRNDFAAKLIMKFER